MTRPGGEVQAPAHPAGVALQRPVGCVGQLELIEQLDGTCARGPPGQPAEPADHHEVLAAAQGLVDGRPLGGDADRAPDRVGLGDDVEARDPRVPLVGLAQRRQHTHGGRLAGAVGAEHAEDLAGCDLQVEPVERLGEAEALAQPLGFDHRFGHANILLTGRKVIGIVHIAYRSSSKLLRDGDRRDQADHGSGGADPLPRRASGSSTSRSSCSPSRATTKTSLRDIAERLGTTKAAIYYHFERKEDILLELHLRLHAFGRGLIDELEQLPDDRARLEAWPQMLGRFIEQVAGSRELIRMHQRNPTALHALEDNERHQAENAEFEEQIRGLLSSPTIDPAMRVRLLCSLGAVFAGLLGADLLGDVSDEQLPGLVRDIVVGMFA